MIVSLPFTGEYHRNSVVRLCWRWKYFILFGGKYFTDICYKKIFFRDNFDAKISTSGMAWSSRRWKLTGVECPGYVRSWRVSTSEFQPIREPQVVCVGLWLVHDTHRYDCCQCWTELCSQCWESHAAAPDLFNIFCVSILQLSWWK